MSKNQDTLTNYNSVNKNSSANKQITDITDLLNSQQKTAKNIQNMQNINLFKKNTKTLSTAQKPNTDSSRFDFHTENSKHYRNTFESDSDFKADFLGSDLNQFNKASNIFQHNILENFSPEMLSPEETIDLMTEILKRVTRSCEMMRLMTTNPEFKSLMSTITRQQKENISPRVKPQSMSNAIMEVDLTGARKSF